MEENRKKAYRNLIYQALLTTRSLSSASSEKTTKEELMSAMREIRDTNQWLHNLANSSAKEFAGFDEEQFWAGGSYFQNRHPESYRHYQVAFGVLIK